MAKKLPRVRSMRTPVIPEQTLAGRYVTKQDELDYNVSGQQYDPRRERHKRVTAAEALQAYRTTKGRAVVSVFGVNPLFSPKFLQGKPHTKENLKNDIAWRTGIMTESGRKRAEKELEAVEADVKQFKADYLAQQRASARMGPGARFNRSQIGFATSAVQKHEDALMLEWANRWIKTKGNTDYERVYALAFSTAPLKKR